MRIAILGGHGQLGLALYDACKLIEEVDLVSFGSTIADVTNVNSLVKVAAERPDVIINCAAFTDVTRAEYEIEKTFAINAFGAANVGKIASTIDAEVIHISTDYVFDGEDKWYNEDDATNPLNVYGVSKLVGEKLLRMHFEKAYILRVSALYSTQRETSLPYKIYWNLKKRQPIFLTSNNTTFPTHCADLANGIVEFLGEEHSYGIYHMSPLSMSGVQPTPWPPSWFDFGYKMAELMNAPTSLIKIGNFHEMQPHARRPKAAVLYSAKGAPKLPPWEEGLKKFLQEMNELIPVS